MSSKHMHEPDKPSDGDQNLDRYFDALNAEPVATPALLKGRILDALPAEPTFDVVRWLFLPWWRPALTAAAPLVLGFALGFFAPMESPEADDGDWLLQAAFGHATILDTTLETDDLTGDADDAS